MLRSLVLPQRPLTILLSLAVCFSSACSLAMDDTSGGDDDSGNGDGSGDASSGEGGTADQSAGSGDSGTADGGSGPDSGDASSDDAGSTDESGDSGNPPNPDGMGPAPVDLGSNTDLATPGSYVLLAKTGITNVTGSMIDGDVGLSPAAASFITGFSLIADPSNVFSTSIALGPDGRVYASNYAAPTPANLTTAVLGMETAYTNAAGRSNPDFLNLGSGDIGGLTLEPGLYTWGSGVTIPEDVTISGAENDVWIFQVSNDLDLSTAQSVVLSGGAQPRNIFWQVAGEVTIHADAHFEGIILGKTGITLQTNASMNGRALSQTLIALDDNAVTAP